MPSPVSKNLIARLLPVAVVTVLIAFCFLPSAFGQAATATLSGTVVDQNGAAIPGVAITVLNTATSLQREVTSNEQGGFVVPLLSPGTYQVRAGRDGFARLEIPNVVLNVGDQKALQIQLKAGDVNATVTVDSNADAIRTDGSVGTVVDRQFVGNVPLNGRSLQSLISLTPGVIFTPVKSGGAVGGQFSVNGQRTNANYFTVDGVSANYGIEPNALMGQSGSGSLPGLTAVGGTNSLVSIDALQEFKILTSSFAPEFGRTPGGQIQLLTRSGTNSFHGTVFDYLRNDVLDANDWFANRSGLPRAKERQNDFGGVIGGPVIKNRTFFFFSYEGLRLRQPLTSISTVPSIQARQLVADVVKPFFNAFPIPNLPEVSPGLAQFAASYSNPGTLDAYSMRIDYSLSEKMMLFGTYRHAPSRTQSRGGPLNVINSVTFKNDAVTVGLTWLESASITNEVRFNWSRARAARSSTADGLGEAVVPDDSSLFVSPQNRRNAVVNWQVFNGSALAGNVSVGAGADDKERQMNLIDTFSWVQGTHQFKFGVDYRRISPILNKSGGNITTLRFNPTSPQPTLPFVSLNVASPDENIVLFQNFSTFVQDVWKVRAKLTLTYGLRWDLNPPPSSKNGHPPSVLLNIGPAGPASLAPPGTPLYKTQYANFAPRFGISYQLSQRPGRETVVRGGAGMFYDLGSGVLAAEFSSIFPYFAQKIYFNVSYPLDPNQVKPPALGVDPPSQFFLADPNLKIPYTAQWNAALEQSLGRSQTLTVSYVGAAGRRLLRLSSSNTTVTGFGSTPVFYSLTKNEGRSDYGALQFQFQRRLSRGIQGLLSYTWARSYDTVSDDVAAGLRGVLSQFINLDQDYAPSDFDVRHSLSGALTVDLPAIPGPRAVNLVTKGWGFDSLLRFRTALPTNLTAVILFGPSGSFARPNIVPGVPQLLFGPQYPGGKAVNPAAFTTPPNNTQGTFPRNSLRFFNASQLDLALRRQFPLTERVKLQFRFEFFNIFNHPNFTDPTGFSAGSNVSIQMLSRGLGGLNPLYQIGGPRSGQVGLRLIF